jgi:hypothetical protein
MARPSFSRHGPDTSGWAFQIFVLNNYTFIDNELFDVSHRLFDYPGNSGGFLYHTLLWYLRGSSSLVTFEGM